jgi:hypothetical protein
MAENIDDFARRESEDENFHRLLAKATGNGSLELVVEGLWGQRAELWGQLQRHFHTSDLAHETVRDHRAIAAAVAAHDADAARDALQRHLARVVREFERSVESEQHAEHRNGQHDEHRNGQHDEHRNGQHKEQHDEPHNQHGNGEHSNAAAAGPHARTASRESPAADVSPGAQRSSPVNPRRSR